MKLPLVSVLMCVHNGEEFLAEAIDSILGQTFRDFELIVVDDASTDGSLQLINGVRDTRLNVVKNERNEGLADSLNRALYFARGEFVARMDADDIAYPERLLAQVARMKEESDLVLLGTSFDYIDAHGVILMSQSVNTCNDILQGQLINDRNQFCHPSVMMRKDTLCKVRGYRKLAGRYAQDYDLWLRLAEAGTVANLPESLLGYRIHANQVSINNLFLQRRAAEIYKALARQRRSTGCEDLPAASLEVDSNQYSLRTAVALDYLHWSDLFSRMSATRRSIIMQIKALWLSRFNPVIQKIVLSKLFGWS